MRRHPTRQPELAAYLRSLAELLGRTPSARDLRAADGPPPDVFQRRFGSLRFAQRAAGLTPNRSGAAGHVARRAPLIMLVAGCVAPAVSAPESEPLTLIVPGHSGVGGLVPGHSPDVARVMWAALELDGPAELRDVRFRTGPFYGGVTDVEGQVLVATIARDEYGRPVPGVITHVSSGLLLKRESPYRVPIVAQLGAGLHLVGVLMLTADANSESFPSLMIWADTAGITKRLEVPAGVPGAGWYSGLVTSEPLTDYFEAGVPWQGELVVHVLRQVALTLAVSR